MVDLSAIASSPVPIGCTSESVCRKCFHGTIVLKHVQVHIIHFHTINLVVLFFHY